MTELAERLARLSPEKRKLLQLMAEKKQAEATERPPSIVEDRWFNLEPGVFPEKNDVRDLYDTVTSQLNASEFGQHSVFLNWGYVPNHMPHFSQVELPELYLNKNATRLVLEVIADTPLGPGDRVLDVACGRGGTVSVVRDFFGVALVAGLDLSPAAACFCRLRHRYPNTWFVNGDSEGLPFADTSMTVVTNLESSHCYPNIHRFYRAVFRVLAPGGHFCYTDILPTGRIEELEGLLADAGFEVLRRRNITSNVLLSCDDIAGKHARLFAGNDDYVTGNFLAVPGSRIYNDMRNGAQTYMLYQLRKPGEEPT